MLTHYIYLTDLALRAKFFGPYARGIFLPVGPYKDLARRPVGPKDREHVKSITYKALARVDATAKYSHSGEMLSWGL